VFESLEAFNAGLPRSFTKRVGDPNISYANLQAGYYVQDDIRVKRSLTLTPGLRYEAQTHIRDYNNVSPRFGLTWAPFKNGKTTLRGSWGLFYDWLQTGIYQQTLQIDGFRQQELQIANPLYPDLGSSGTLTAVNRYLLDPGLRSPRTQRASAGIDYAFTPQIRVNATFRVTQGSGTFRGENLNAPDPATHLRVDPTFGNVIKVVSDARCGSAC
jgi:outer membrane receptor protein involved in Fe transport